MENSNNRFIRISKDHLAAKLNEEEPGRYSVIILVADEKDNSVMCDCLVNSDEDLKSILEAMLRGMNTEPGNITKGPKYRIQ